MSIDYDSFVEALRNSGSKRHLEILKQIDPAQKAGEHDPLYQKALRIAIQNPGCTAKLIGSKLDIGYGRSAAMMDAIRKQGIKY